MRISRRQRLRISYGSVPRKTAQTPAAMSANRQTCWGLRGCAVLTEVRGDWNRTATARGFPHACYSPCDSSDAVAADHPAKSRSRRFSWIPARWAAVCRGRRRDRLPRRGIDHRRYRRWADRVLLGTKGPLLDLPVIGQGHADILRCLADPHRTDLVGADVKASRWRDATIQVRFQAGRVHMP